ncbi:MAG: hypothetical protein KGL39_47850 [Patescibacteria group bacterium]|nr:hypothetical protein [Patescibacteria group bacterium]
MEQTMYQPGDVIVFNGGGGVRLIGVVWESLGSDYRVLPDQVDRMWVIHPHEIEKKIGTVDLHAVEQVRFP